MTHYRDLSACDYFGPDQGKLIAIGWLEPEHEYSRGTVQADFFRALVHLLIAPWQPAVAAGRHTCRLCRFTGGPSALQYGDLAIKVGAANLFVPSATCIFVAPSLVAHYIDSHGYAPPAEYQQAVLSCPPMRSIAYLQGIRKHDGHRLLSR
jgi:hypothetical protein